MKENIEALTYGNATQVGRKINQLTKALSDVEEYHHIQKSQPIRHYLSETRKDLKQMIRVSNIQVEILTHISLISDISYTWLCLPEYIPIIQQRVQRNPDLALHLKSTFIKLSSILNTPMVRIL